MHRITKQNSAATLRLLSFLNRRKRNYDWRRENRKYLYSRAMVISNEFFMQLRLGFLLISNKWGERLFFIASTAVDDADRSNSRWCLGEILNLSLSCLCPRESDDTADWLMSSCIAGENLQQDGLHWCVSVVAENNKLYNNLLKNSTVYKSNCRAAVWRESFVYQPRRNNNSSSATAAAREMTLLLVTILMTLGSVFSWSVQIPHPDESFGQHL